MVSEWHMADESDERMLKRLLLLQDAARGLKVLHSLNVVHGDLVSPAGRGGLPIPNNGVSQA